MYITITIQFSLFAYGSFYCFRSQPFFCLITDFCRQWLSFWKKWSRTKCISNTVNCTMSWKQFKTNCMTFFVTFTPQYIRLWMVVSRATWVGMRWTRSYEVFRKWERTDFTGTTPLSIKTSNSWIIYRKNIKN